MGSRKKLKSFSDVKNLTIEISCMWNVNTKVIPLIIGTNAAILESFRKYLSNILEEGH